MVTVLALILGAVLLVSNLAQKATIASYQEQAQTDSQTINSLEAEVASLNKEVADKDSQIESLDGEINSLEEDVKKYKKDANKLDEIYTFVQRSDAGGYDYKFKADRNVVVMKKGSPSQKITLTTSYATSYWYELSKQGVVAVDFARDSWSGSFVDINLTPQGVGTTYLTFHNEANSNTFMVMVIVID